jgi:uncharacterized protein
MTGEVRVVYRKYDGSLHWHQVMRLLGEDQHGVWAGSPAPTVLRKGDGPLVTLPYASILLFPRDGCWTAAFNDEPASTEIYCDITTEPRWPDPAQVTMIDLDLDVRRLRDGTVELLDADEFAEHQVRYGYPAEVISSAERTASWLQATLGDGSEPFASAYRQYLAQVGRAGSGPPRREKP